LLFEKFELSQELLNGLKDVNYSKPTELQVRVIPDILKGKNAVIKARSGMGKDGSYIIPIIENLNKNRSKEHTRTLILTPEVDHARKVHEFVWAVGYHADTHCVSVDMDGDRDEQKEAIKQGVDIVVANPGRLEEFLKDDSISFQDLEYIVIDDAYKMSKMGLIPKFEPILKEFAKKTQVLLYSDRLNDELKELIDKYLTEPSVFGFENELGLESGNTGGKDEQEEDSPKEDTVEQPESKNEPVEKKRDVPPPSLDTDLTQGYILVPPRMKISTLMAHLDETPEDNVLVFTASKRGTDRLFRVLRKRGITVRSIHERLPKKERERRYKAFKTGEYQFLLITDISAKDIDFDHVKQVINYDVPNNVDEYRYRAGLVGSGKANRIVSLVSKQDRDDIKAISKEIGSEPTELPLPEKAKEKLIERSKSNDSKSKNKKRNRGRGRSQSKDKSHGNKRSGSNKKKPNRSSRRSSKKRGSEPELPKPSYDKLEGGRHGNEKEKSNDKKKGGVVKFFKKLFS